MNNTIDIFNTIRDIPYRIPLSSKEKDECCSGKHIQLKNIFENMGIKSRFRVCSFQWSDMNLPEKITHIPHEDNSTHVYLEVFIENNWKNIDATWDI